MTTVSEFTIQRRPAHPVRPHVVPFAQAPARGGRSRARRSRETESTGSSGPASCTHAGDYHEEIHQSLAVLKALTYAPTGGIVAAPTTSLPERIGGVRNWDYRYCWLRDATLTLHRDAARRLPRRRPWPGASGFCAQSRATPRTCRSCTGSRASAASTSASSSWLPGYEGSAPVRVGNAASAQLQLDVYGEVIDALYQTRDARARRPTTTSGR